MDLSVEKKVWSRNFWISKLVRTLILVLLAVLLTQLWNWESQQDPVEQTSPVASQTEIEQLTEPVVEEPEEPKFPFEITLPEGTAGPVEIEGGGYQYTFADTATLTVYPEGLGSVDTDVTWTHTTNEEDKLVLGELPTALCVVGATGCSAGNGAIDITSRPAEGETDNFVIVVKDTNVATKTFEQAQVRYVEVIESIEVVR